MSHVQSFLFEVSKSEILCGLILLYVNESIYRFPPPQMRADTQTFTEISFLLLPGPGPTGFEPKPAGEDRKLTGLH